MMLNCRKSTLVCGFLLLFHCLNAQSDSLSLSRDFHIFNGLFSISLPEGSYEDSVAYNEVYSGFGSRISHTLYSKKGDRLLTITPVETHRTSTNNLKTSVLRYLKQNQHDGATDKEVTEVTSYSNLKIVVWTPFRKNRNHQSKFYKGIFILSNEGLVYYLSTTLNSSAINDLGYYNSLVFRMTRSIKQINSVDISADKKIPITLQNGKTLIVNCPKNYYINNSLISKYCLFAASKIVELEIPQSPSMVINIIDSTIFYKPQTLYSGNENGIMFDKPIEWQKFSTGSSKNMLRLHRLKITSENHSEYFFVVLEATDKNTIDELKTIAGKIILVN